MGIPDDRGRDIFVSYSSQDQLLAQTLVGHIQGANLSAFIASKSIPAGESWNEWIRSNLRSCRCVVVLLSPNSIASDWVIAECYAAWVLDKLIIPVLSGCDTSQIPRQLAHLQACAFDDFAKRIQEAAATLPLAIPYGSLHRAGGNKTLVFYAPTFRGNSFFEDLLHYAWGMAKEKGWGFIIERGESDVGSHQAGNYLKVIERHADKDQVLLMIPPSPDCYKKIWELPGDTPVNLVTLDMEIPPMLQQSEFPPFLKQVILVDNKLGAELAAEEVAKYWQQKRQDINVLICEGEFHDRGRDFKVALESKAKRFDVRFLASETLSFSRASEDALRYVRRVIKDSRQELSKRETFIFCANDNLALGARLALSSKDRKDCQGVKIICFDASNFVRLAIDHGDRFFWRAVDQRYDQIVQGAMDAAEALFKGQALRDKEVKVKPQIYG